MKHRIEDIRAAHLSAALRCALYAALCASACLVGGCGLVTGSSSSPRPSEVKRVSKSSPPPAGQARAAFGAPERIATLEDKAIRESSGVVASRRNKGLFWTHNDSGDGPYLYAFDRGGRARGVWRVKGAEALDWEDIAAGPGPGRGRAYLYVGDVGDNDRARSVVTIYRLAEPEVTPADAGSGKKSARDTDAAEAIRLKYPDGRHDAEALLVHPRTGDLYVVTKVALGAAGVYKLKAPYTSASVNTLARVGEVRLPGLFAGLVTGGDISPDGARVVLCDYLNAYELSLPASSSHEAFDSVWKQPTLSIELGEREQGESVCYGEDGASVLATSEKRPTPLIEVKRRK